MKYADEMGYKYKPPVILSGCGLYYPGISLQDLRKTTPNKSNIRFTGREHGPKLPEQNVTAQDTIPWHSADTIPTTFTQYSTFHSCFRKNNKSIHSCMQIYCTYLCARTTVQF